MFLPIYIPTRKRFNVRGGPVRFFSKAALAQTTFVVHPDELDRYKREAASQNLDVAIVAVDYGDSIGRKRQLIGELAAAAGHEKFIMFDDDVTLYQRKAPDDYHLRDASKDDVDQMLATVSSLLDQVASVGISSREGNNHPGPGHPLAANMAPRHTRVMRVLAYRTEDFLDCEHDRVRVMEDFDVQLQLLRRGLGNACLFFWANGQTMTNAPGGCSLWRTPELHEAAARRLAELHRGFVRLTQKKNKTDATGFGTRTEVVVSWKAAAESAAAMARDLFEVAAIAA